MATLLCLFLILSSSLIVSISQAQTLQPSSAPTPAVCDCVPGISTGGVIVLFGRVTIDPICPTSYSYCTDPYQRTESGISYTCGHCKYYCPSENECYTDDECASRANATNLISTCNKVSNNTCGTCSYSIRCIDECATANECEALSNSTAEDGTTIVHKCSYDDHRYSNTYGCNVCTETVNCAECIVGGYNIYSCGYGGNTGCFKHPSNVTEYRGYDCGYCVSPMPTTAPTTYTPTTNEPTTAEPTTTEPTDTPSTDQPTAAHPTTGAPTTAEPTTVGPTTYEPTTGAPTTSEPTTDDPTMASNLCSNVTGIVCNDHISLSISLYS